MGTFNGTSVELVSIIPITVILSDTKKMKLETLALLIVMVVSVSAGTMKLYEKTSDDKFQRVLIPVSSTVIPLDDLPTYQVSAGFGPIKPQAGIVKPKGPYKLITSKTKKNTPTKKKTSYSAIVEEQKPDSKQQ